MSSVIEIGKSHRITIKQETRYVDKTYKREHHSQLQQVFEVITNIGVGGMSTGSPYLKSALPIGN